MTARQTWTLILVVVAVLGMGIWLGMPETTSGNYAEVPTRPTAEPTTSPTATADRSNRVVTDRPERVAWRPLPTGFSDRMQPLLKRGAQLEIAAEEFTSAEQFATVAHAANNTEIPFMVLKDRVVNEGKSVQAAIAELKPELNAKAEAERARAAAKKDVAEAIGEGR